MTWTNTGGGDHEGAAWTPGDTTIIAGIHYNITTFTVTNGYTISIELGTELEVYANTILVAGILNGNAKGSAGGTGIIASNTDGNVGSSSGGGPGGDGGALVGNCGAGGAGGGAYGNTGGTGGAGDQSSPASGGILHGSSAIYAIELGSGGGQGGNGCGNTGNYNNGGNGGGSVLLSANTLTITGTVQCNGENGDNGRTGSYHNGGGGGGSGGGILLVGGAVIISGTLTVTGGVGGDDGNTFGGGAGGGSGGRTKIFYRTINTAGSTITVTGSAGGAGHNNGGAGGTGTSSQTEIGRCTDSIEFGQTFKMGTNGEVELGKVTLWVDTVNTGGNFTLKIWDSPSKNIEKGSTTVNITGTGVVDSIFSPQITSLSAATSYYMELTGAAGTDIELGIYGNDPYSNGDYYIDQVLITRFDIYFLLVYGNHTNTPQIFNTADSTIKSNVANKMLGSAIYRINTDGIGTINYNDDFTTQKHLGDYTALSGITHDQVNDELDIADDGYIYWKKDTKFPINGIPTLTSWINITSGIPTIQISTDASTWYDIDTAMVDIVFSSDLTPGMTFSASSIHSADYNADKAFDDGAGYWITAGGQPSAGQWIKVDFGTGNSKTIQKITIKGRSAKGFNSFKLQGSNNDSNWTDIYSGTGSSSESTISFTFVNFTEYRYYRIYCISGHDTNTLRVTEIEMMECDMTIYPLDSDGNLSLAGETVFYFRIDCVKAAAATCSIKYFELDINIHTIYAKNPKITKGSLASTFRIDQDPDSGIACIVDLIYRDKWWV